MTTTVQLRRPLDRWAAMLLVVSMASVLIVATWLFLNNGSPAIPGALIWLGWGVYPGAAAVVALRFDSEAHVTAVAVLVPSLAVAAFSALDGTGLAPLSLPLGVAAGIFVGMWLGTAVIRPGGRVRLLAGLIAAGLAGAAVTLVMWLPAMLIVT